jgi:hypothetical protein
LLGGVRVLGWLALLNMHGAQGLVMRRRLFGALALGGGAKRGQFGLDALLLLRLEASLLLAAPLIGGLALLVHNLLLVFVVLGCGLLGNLRRGDRWCGRSVERSVCGGWRGPGLPVLVRMKPLGTLTVDGGDMAQLRRVRALDRSRDGGPAKAGLRIVRAERRSRRVASATKI